MTRQYVDINHKWAIIVYHGVSARNEREIENALQRLGCPKHDIGRAIEIIAQPNTGFTYSNHEARMSMVAISVASNKGEYLNTIVHECHHVVSAVCKHFNIDESSECAAYILGDIVMKITSARAEIW